MPDTINPCPKCGRTNTVVNTVKRQVGPVTLIRCLTCGYSLDGYGREPVIEDWNKLSDITKPFWIRRRKSEKNKN